MSENARRRGLGWFTACAVFCAVLFAPAVAAAHLISVALLDIVEVEKGEYLLRWSSSETGMPDFKLDFPQGCRQPAFNRLWCPGAGLTGDLRVATLGSQQSAALVRITWIDGTSSAHTLTGANPAVHLYGSARDPRQWRDILVSYVGLGIEHILQGIDHLLFVFSLTTLVGWGRRLLWTITAFTVAHSVTLAASALGLIGLHPQPVEVLIALSIVLVSAECLSPRDTWAKRWPWLVAFFFGLVHGLGFAGALRAIGLPPGNVPLALFSFNVGVELGQLAVVALCFLLLRLLNRVPGVTRRLPMARVAVVYVIGSVATYWTLDRLAAFVT